ncbi:MAG: DNA-3-methyladenine glycosylase 2 family protein [Williamsia sp.]|nr:DNA-3-methyladenine glycosylase 2 family protein [Williamsia sp.]
MADYISHLIKDKKLGGIIDVGKPVELVQRKKVYLRLCASIMSQQLSTKVAAVIYRRFLELYGGEEPTPEQIANTPFDTLRSIGLSNAKTGYVHNVAKFVAEQGMDDEKLATMSNEEIIEQLTSIKGVGRWTVEMLLMFTLGREDVFAVDDLGIQQAMIRLYKLDRTNKKEFIEKMRRISAKWKPYRTYACLHLWQWKDAPPEK